MAAATWIGSNGTAVASMAGGFVLARGLGAAGVDPGRTAAGGLAGIPVLAMGALGVAMYQLGIDERYRVDQHETVRFAWRFRQQNWKYGALLAGVMGCAGLALGAATAGGPQPRRAVG